MVEFPLSVDVGETVPHCATEQKTDQVTPMLERSLVTVAVNGAVPPAGTLGEPAETETEMTGGGCTMELPPLQPGAVITEVKSRMVRSTEVARFIDASRGLALAPTGRLAPEWRCTPTYKICKDFRAA